MPRLLLLLPLFALPLLAGQPGGEKKNPLQPLFDGKSFAGWDGDTKAIWRIEDGCLVGGSLDKKIKQNEFLATKASYRDFSLKLKFKLLGDPKKGFVNSGVQIRSERDPKSSEMIGYQCDLGDPSWWGCVYDESRRNKVMAQSDMKAVEKVLKRGEWNDYEVRAEGRRIRTFINGALAVDYTEEDLDIPQHGRLGLQIHGGGPAEVWFKDIMIEELPAVKEPADLVIGAPPPPAPPHASPLTPAEELKTFSLPPGFEIELVASEPDVGKPITVAWDHAGRLWTMSALEYPLDANEDPAKSKALFAQGGKDRVLVFDKPYGPGPHTPRVFAEGLAIPLGMLPYKDGCFVQYGNQILRLRDTDDDGKADKREVFLDGFGTDDSHLFPHQFTRGPGGWLYFAQGAFNHSKVKTKEGPAVRMSYCKMARVRFDGTGFELVQAGLNNIWGFVIDRHGSMFIQEANDLGYPVVPFEVGANFPGIGMEKLKPYAPWTPTVPHTFRVGGTGLSGLALIQDEAFAAAYPKEGKTFFLANPITRKVQAVWMEPTPKGDRLRLLPDFLLSSDPWFRPVSIHFGPDECLYVVDWCNAVISHNEVPRNHPERDKTRGRIWRIRAKGQDGKRPTDVTTVSDAELLKLLASKNVWEGTAAWQQIVDRGGSKLTPELARLAGKAALPTESRLRALWALEGLGAAEPPLLLKLLGEPSESLRREATRILGTLALDENAVTQALAALSDDPSSQVRAAAIRSLGASASPSQERLAALIRFAGSELPGPTERLEQGGTAKLGAALDRDFERYLVRAALEKQPKLLAQLLISNAGEGLPAENLAFAALALVGPEAALFLAKQLMELKRPPNQEELLRLAQHADDAGVRRLLPPLIEKPETLRQLLEQRSRFDAANLKPLLLPALRKLWADEKQADLVYRAAAAFQLNELESDFKATGESAAGPRRLFAVKALRELNTPCTELFTKVCVAEAAPSPLKEEALLGLAGCPDGAAPLLKLLPDLNARERRLSLDKLVGAPAGAKAAVAAFASGALAENCLEAALVEKLQAVLKDDAALTDFLKTQERFLRPVLRLDGRDDTYVADEITLEGPFTVETWVKLEPGISNADSILGRPGVADLNFAGAHFRVWGGPAGDLIIAKKQVFPEAWTHVAVTRDLQGRFALYLNGELDTAECRPSLATWKGLRIGHSNPPQGTKAAFAEFRLWNLARSPEQIRETFDQSLVGGPAPAGLTRLFGGTDWGKLHGSARLVSTTDFPPLLTAAEAEAQAAKFAQYRAMVKETGDLKKGRALFEKNCMTCHTALGQGGQIGPTLNGAGTLGDEALLRNLLTPSVAMEPGYRLFRVELQSGVLKDGFLVRQDEKEIVLRKPGEEDQRIDAKKAAFAGFSKRSVMPDGVLEALKPEEVRDLFSYLRTLK